MVVGLVIFPFIQKMRRDYSYELCFEFIMNHVEKKQLDLFLSKHVIIGYYWYGKTH